MGQRFQPGDKVWVRDRRLARGGFKVEPAVVVEYAPRYGFKPNDEGYELDGYLYWTTYPGCRVFATRHEASTTCLPY